MIREELSTLDNNIFCANEEELSFFTVKFQGFSGEQGLDFK